MTPERLRALTQIGYLTLVAVLPLHTVFIRAEIAWKPWVVILLAVVALDIWSSSGFPWSRRASVGVAAFLVLALVSWQGPESTETFWHLWLALAAGGLLLLSTARHAQNVDHVLRVVFWSGAAIGLTGMLIGLATNGVFGEQAVVALNEIALVDRVNKPAYLGSGFVAVTNWHQDPGYSALWSNVWLVLASFAWTRGTVQGPRWLGPLVIGGLASASVLTYSRTGWLGLLAAVVVVLVSQWRTGSEMFRHSIVLLSAGLAVGGLLIGAQIALDPQDVGGDVLTAFEFRFAHIGELGAVDLGEVGIVDPTLVVEDNRLDVWREYVHLFSDHPIRGIGLGSGWSEPGLQEPHNMWLELLAETGIVGLMGFTFLVSRLGAGGGPVAGSVLVVVGLATLSQTVLFEPVLWFALGLRHSGVLAGVGPEKPTTIRLQRLRTSQDSRREGR